MTPKAIGRLQISHQYNSLKKPIFDIEKRKKSAVGTIRNFLEF